MGWASKKCITAVFTAVAFCSLVQSAAADPDEVELDFQHDFQLDLDAPLPTSLDSWVDPGVLPQGRLTSKPPFTDFGKMQFDIFFGVVGFGSSFDADPSWVFGLGARLPIDGISKNFGVFGQVLFSYIDRDLPFYITNNSGNWMGFTLGMDYAFFNNETALLRGQLGAMYAWFDDLKAVDDGWGVVLGLELGFYWIRQTPTSTFNITPQIVTNGSDVIYLLTFGFEVTF